MSAPVSILVLDRVRAGDSAGPSGRPRGHLFGLTAAFGPGVHAVLGAPEDGTLALAGLLGGRVAPTAGRVTVAGREPARDAAIRARIGVLAAVPELPDAGTVAFSAGLALRARGQRGPGADAAGVLTAFGLAPLLGRRSVSLSFAEARAVELALALTTPAPLLVGLVEPLCDVAVPSSAGVQQRVRDLGAAGVCVVVFTSSPADARALADRIHVLDRGVIARIEPGDGAWGRRPGGGSEPQPGAPVAAELLVLVSEVGAPGAAAAPEADGAAAGPRGVRALAAAVARCPEVRAVAWEEASDASSVSSLRVQAVDRDAAALAILDAAAAGDVTVVAISSPSPSLQRVRADTAAHLAVMRPLRAFGAPALLLAPPPVPAPVQVPSVPGDAAPEDAAAPGDAAAPEDAAAPGDTAASAGTAASEAPPAPGDAAARPPAAEEAR